MCLSAQKNARRKHRKKKIPTVAMTSDEYKQKRGMIGIEIFIQNQISSYQFFVPGNSIKKQNEEEQSKTQDFDLKKHLERNKKLNNNRQKKVIL